MNTLKNDIHDTIKKVQGYKDGLMDSLLEEDITMALMNLSYMKEQPSLYK